MDDDYLFNVKKKRPEDSYEHVSDYFKGETLTQYANSKSVMRTQEKITIRALELLDLKQKRAFILDAGCGPGFVGMYLKEIGFNVVAIDLLSDFLTYYNISELNPVQADMCFPPFREASFDAIISISALQWIFSDLSNPNTQHSMKYLISAFYRILKPNSKIVFQFYPKSNNFLDELGRIIKQESSFNGTYVIDNPENPKKRKIYLFLEKTE
ncbi:MAG: class I SAM-dependent methyltransferase [Candidatus Lokiarchaeota archaeon]|nr:class I SAM-dependent methyltransferase [Candidatus Lokiarchaeota archaeon]